MAAAGLYEVYLQARFDIGHGGHWPGDMARAHELAWMAVALLVAALVGEFVAADEPAPDETAEPAVDGAGDTTGEAASC